MLGVWVVVRELVSPGCDILPRVSWVSVVGVGNGGYGIGVTVLPGWSALGPDPGRHIAAWLLLLGALPIL